MMRQVTSLGPMAAESRMANGEAPRKKIGHYTISQVLGVGGMGVVYRATDDLLDREVAIKTFHHGSIDREETVERFHAEARSLARLRHPNIVTIYELGVDDPNDPYIVMEFVSGKSLQKVIESKVQIPVAGRVRLVRDVCNVLAYAHKQGVIHRDIKPSNIFVQTKGEIKLLDFGIAQLTERDRKLTRLGAVIGSVEYIAPERLRGETPDGRSDLFSVGVVLYQLLEERLPFTAESEFSLMRKIVEEPFPPLDAKWSYPASLTQAVDRALSKSPSDRYQTADEMANALTAVLDKLGAESSEDWTSFLEKIAPVRPTPPAAQPPRPGGPKAIQTSTTTTAGRVVTAESIGMTKLSAVPTPTGFLTGSIVSRTRFFEGDKVRYEKIEETLKFYREHLDKDYGDLSNQAKFTYFLWIASVLIGLGALVAGMVLLVMGQLRAGSISTISAAFVYFIQKVFQQREDHYRELAGAKQKVLEYGNHWLLVIQSIDAIEDSAERERRQSELVNVLTNKLGSAEANAARQAQPAGRRKRPAAAAVGPRE